jgi:hypothetical protein
MLWMSVLAILTAAFVDSDEEGRFMFALSAVFNAL